MAQPTVQSFGKGIVFVGDGASPDEAFTKLCGFNAMNLTIEKDTNDVTIPDCDDPDAAAWRATDLLSLAWSMEFGGVYAKESSDLLWEVATDGQSRSIRLHFVGGGSGGATPDLRFSGKGHFGLGLTGERGSKWENTVNVTGDGALTRASVAAFV